MGRKEFRACDDRLRPIPTLLACDTPTVNAYPEQGPWRLNFREFDHVPGDESARCLGGLSKHASLDHIG